MKVGFIGVGKLGLSCAEMIAEKHEVVGYDINPVEPQNFEMVQSIKAVAELSEVIFVAVPTPHDKRYGGETPTAHLDPKDFDYSIVRQVLEELDRVVDVVTSVVLISTVLPGTIRGILAPSHSNLSIIYNPYLIAMGTVKWDMVNPEMIMIGTETGTPTSGVQMVKQLYESIMRNDPPIYEGTWEEIESLKVFYNTFISAKVGLVNMIQDVSVRLGNMDAGFVCNALANCDRRIMGRSYMAPGMGDGGACHPRDNIALRFLAQKLDLGYDLFASVMESREIQAKNMAQFL